MSGGISMRHVHL